MDEETCDFHVFTSRLVACFVSSRRADTSETADGAHRRLLRLVVFILTAPEDLTSSNGD